MQTCKCHVLSSLCQCPLETHADVSCMCRQLILIFFFDFYQVISIVYPGAIRRCYSTSCGDTVQYFITSAKAFLGEIIENRVVDNSVSICRHVVKVNVIYQLVHCFGRTELGNIYNPSAQACQASFIHFFKTYKYAIWR